MITVPELAVKALDEFLGAYMRRRFGTSQSQLVEIVPNAARIALECIGNSDALYHNIEHTMLVTLAGHDIFRGHALNTNVTAEDYAHIILACLFHDIGYVRGLFPEDGADGFVIDAAGNNKVTLQRGASDAALMPYHVDRSKRYVLERMPGLPGVDAKRVAAAIEGTRFPPVEGQQWGAEAESFGRPISSGNSAIRTTCARPTRSTTSSKRSASTVSSATIHQPTSSIAIRNSTGTASRPISRPRYAT